MQIFKTETNRSEITISIHNSVESCNRTDALDYYDRATSDHYMGNRLFNFYDRVVYLIFNSDGSVFNCYLWGEL